MSQGWFQLVAAAALIVAVSALWYVNRSRLLTGSELARLAFERRVRAVASRYSFGVATAAATSFDFRSFKSSMKAAGGWARIDEPVANFPSLAAALLKGKKHEWFLFAYVRDDRVVGLWMNKGSDRTKVTPLLPIGQFLHAAVGARATDVLEFHNHPNPNPRLYSTGVASPQDQISADLFGPEFSTRGVAFHAFVTERGRHVQYGSWIPVDSNPLSDFGEQARRANGQSRWRNFQLRQELGRPNQLSAMMARPNCSTNLKLSPGMSEAGVVRTPGPLTR